uniref:G-protein coupled receptors family 2 profile 2 domain-containing protein n=1 Tax=Fibrocapsa japonica TaxID=94617 RepID=A0A7S2V1W1_9STRA
MAMKDFSDQRMTPYHIYVWGSALLLALIPVNYYGQTTGWCWITITSVVDFDPGTALRFFCFYVPLWLAVIFNAFAYYSVTRSVRGMLAAQTEETSDRLLRLVRRLRWYPFIMIIAYFWATINRIYNSINPGQPVFWLIFLQAAFRSAQGLMNSMAYGYNPTVREAWRKECCAAGSTCAAVLQMTKLQHPSEAPMNTEEPSTTDDAAPEGVEIHVELQESTANPV